MLPADLEELELEAAASPFSLEEASGFSCSTAFAAAAASSSTSNEEKKDDGAAAAAAS